MFAKQQSTTNDAKEMSVPVEFVSIQSIFTTRLLFKFHFKQRKSEAETNSA